MRVIVVGMGVQGKKRLRFAGADAVATVDPVAPDVDFRKVEDVSLSDYDAVLCCVPDEVKPEMLRYLLANGKHLLVEKPLVDENREVLEELKALAESNNTVCYTAYNHRFEPHLVTLKKLLDSGQLGQPYSCRFFYGNGTARDVRNSVWRDKDLGVIADLGSHLLDWSRFLFGDLKGTPEILSADCFENRAYDHSTFSLKDKLLLQYEVTLLSWRNMFRLDLFAEKGTVQIDCLCKWGPSTITIRDRVLPSGRPDERSETLICADPTWEIEYAHFLELCRNPSNNIDTDLWINDIFNNFRQQLL